MIRAGETYTIDPVISREQALAYWFGTDRETFVTEVEAAILGTYYIRTNFLIVGAPVGVCTCAGATVTSTRRRRGCC